MSVAMHLEAAPENTAVPQLPFRVVRSFKPAFRVTALGLQVSVRRLSARQSAFLLEKPVMQVCNGAFAVAG
ncbi:MAG: hypothetical protein AAF638_03870, partial [Pseudomonadota bacterium]